MLSEKGLDVKNKKSKKGVNKMGGIADLNNFFSIEMFYEAQNIGFKMGYTAFLADAKRSNVNRN